MSSAAQGANTGTVPSKTLRETAMALSGLRSRDLYGVDLSIRRQATVADFLRHERTVKSGLNAMFAQRLDAFHTDVFFGDASFVDPHTVRVRTIPKSQAQDQHKADAASDNGELSIRGENILIATGSSPVRPAMFPYGPGVYDSDTLLDLVNLPKTMAVVGAGTIGSEYACTFAALGTTVHLIDSHDVLMSFLDSEISRALVTEMERNGIVFHWKERSRIVHQERTSRAGKPRSVHPQAQLGAGAHRRRGAGLRRAAQQHREPEPARRGGEGRRPRADSGGLFVPNQRPPYLRRG